MFNNKKIQIDIDDKEIGKQTLRILRILKIKGKYRLSSSKRGYHFVIDTNKHTKKENLIIRYIFNDCNGRWNADLRRLKHGIALFDILFDKKKNRKATKWRNI